MGQLVGLASLGALLFLGDKFFLFLSESRRPSTDYFLTNTIKNGVSRLGLKRIEIYVCYKYPSNLYVLKTLGGRSSLIIGRDIEEKLSFEEAQALIYNALIRINSHDALVKYVFLNVFLLFVLPVYLFDFFLKRVFGGRRIGGYILQPMLSLIHYFVTPLDVLKRYLFFTKKKTLRLDERTVELFDCRRSLASAIYKVGMMNWDEKEDNLSLLLESVAIAENRSRKLVDHVSGPSEFFKDRYQSLNEK